MMFLVLAKTPIGAVDYLLEHTSRKYLKVQIKELCQLICSAGYSDVYDKIPQGKEIQNWIKANHTNELYVWYYLSYAFHMLYVPGFGDAYDVPEKQRQIFDDFTEKITLKDWDKTNATDIQTAIFRYQKEYESPYPTNIELDIDTAVKEYRKYLNWKIKYKPNYFERRNNGKRRIHKRLSASNR